MCWKILPISGFCDYSDSWQSIVDECYFGHPFLDHRFIKWLIYYFSDENDCLCVEYVGNKIESMALLHKANVVTWETFCPSQSPIALYISSNKHYIAESKLNLFKVLGKGALLLGVKHYDVGYYPKLNDNLCVYSKVNYAETMSISLEGEFNDYWTNRSKNLRKNMARRFKKIEKDNVKVTLDIITDPKHIKLGVASYGELESKGWKGQSSSAINGFNNQGKFYRDMMSEFSMNDGAAIYNLLFNGIIVSSRLILKNKDIILILKTTYDEKYAQYSPGRVLLYLMLENLFKEKKYKIVEFYTKANNDQLQWHTSRRMIEHINIYRNCFVSNCYNVIRRVRDVLAMKI